MNKCDTFFCFHVIGQVVVAAETGGALGGMVRQLSIDQFENEGRRVSYGTPESATAARKLLDRQMSINSVPKKVQHTAFYVLLAFQSVINIFFCGCLGIDFFYQLLISSFAKFTTFSFFLFTLQLRARLIGVDIMLMFSSPSLIIFQENIFYDINSCQLDFVAKYLYDEQDCRIVQPTTNRSGKLLLLLHIFSL